MPHHCEGRNDAGVGMPPRKDSWARLPVRAVHALDSLVPTWRAHSPTSRLLGLLLDPAIRSSQAKQPHHGENGLP